MRTVSKPDLKNNPGFLFRRLQQVSVSLFLQRLRQFGITPLQYTILRIIEAQPGIDQISVASQAVLDTSTVKDIVARLEAKKLIARRIGEHDRRSRAVSLTRAGSQLLVTIEPYVRRSQKELLAPLSEHQRSMLLRTIHTLLVAHEEAVAQTTEPWRRFRKRSNS